MRTNIAGLDLRMGVGSKTLSFVRGVACDAMAMVASHRCESHYFFFSFFLGFRRTQLRQPFPLVDY